MEKRKSGKKSVIVQVLYRLYSSNQQTKMSYSGSTDGGSDSRLKRKGSPESTTDNKSCKKLKQFDKKYLCDQCDYAAIRAQTLKRHKESKHEVVRYSCDQCDYTATESSNLKKHKESKHEGIRYSCDQCDYTATTTSLLKKHKESKHQGIRYPCDQCEYVAT